MKDALNQSRRNMLKLAGMTAAIIPLAAFAARNEALRTATKYKDTPEGDKECNNCAQWVPGKTPKDLGGCKIYPGDTEVNPKGYCTAWAKKT